MGVINMVRLQISCNNQFYQKQMCITKQALFSYITWQKYFKINFFDTKGHHLFCMWVFRYTGIAYQLLSCTNVKKKKKRGWWCIQLWLWSLWSFFSKIHVLHGHANNVIRNQDKTKTQKSKYKRNVYNNIWFDIPLK